MIKQTCRQCAHFVDDPAFIEAEFPGLTPFGSAYSSARGHAGICQELGRFMDPVLAKDCPSFKPRGQTDGQRMTRRLTKVPPPRCRG
jgi:hypothetical protein